MADQPLAVTLRLQAKNLLPRIFSVTMTISIGGRLMRRCVGVFLVLVTSDLIAPAFAQGGCGSHVTRQTTALGDSLARDLLALQSVVATHVAIPELPKKSPCSGLSCSKGSGLPQVPDSSRAGWFDQWGCLTTSQPFIPEWFDVRQPMEAVAKPVRDGQSLDRPPRATMS